MRFWLEVIAAISDYNIIRTSLIVTTASQGKVIACSSVSYFLGVSRASSGVQSRPTPSNRYGIKTGFSCEAMRSRIVINSQRGSSEQNSRMELGRAPDDSFAGYLQEDSDLEFSECSDGVR